MNHAEELAVCILGAGPVGASLAATLAGAGLPTAVIDQAPLPPMELPEFDGRAYAIALASQRLLAGAGIWDHLPEPPCPIRAIRVADGRPGEPASPLSLHFDAAELGDEPFGWMVEARGLRVALNARLPLLPNLRVFAPAQAEVTRRPEGVRILLSTGEELRARLVVAAEGRNSKLRREAGIRCATIDYRQIGMVGAFAHEKPHGNVALEQFLPNGPFAQLPLSGPGGFGTAAFPHASAFVWADRTAIARRMLALDDAAFARELRRRLGGHLGAVRMIGRRWSYPLSALQVERWMDTRLALVGDAAHGVHPIAGQGLNLGFRDVAALAEEVAAAWQAGEDPGAPEVLARYQARRRPDTLLMLSGMHALERLFGNDIAPIRWARRLGIAAVDRMPRLKLAFARQAMGLA
ncbi:UbiH/UbiF/VisC/COQ6 family ubiquinone biosynthesis hydroxylase [Siccirubricoccus sp. KC 17139]|uniref:UbiH/UbiF/VisC/COQ6 family ubiquinone biosynthesis hydroxylase n=1 Tax=Siccirubricoccus soli TaxID=2899147 RepID=A0ABT1DCP1_9PROT|nr:UbiH/UbiF/VisC/COQ6 family ubiquinone biosynthesis hydroxylase [Siccirubricoccus soli]MCO6418710.1 UbiH/UbiF/VisC/COQ6 family ubiquinone biosynthesis hydroxylase [Siccirubricoccus soli]MCP2684845.1 UbiH/UbiF/VisC/COQ6 family ubiquinone biosynthesis hydroxylase [Siccirubricoccus soli]